MLVFKDFLGQTVTGMILPLAFIKVFKPYFAALIMFKSLLACRLASCNMKIVSLFVIQSIILNVPYPGTLRMMFVLTTANSGSFTDFASCDIKCFFDSFAFY